MAAQPQDTQPAPALAAIHRDFTVGEGSSVLRSRQPGDALTATRVLPLPADAPAHGDAPGQVRAPAPTHENAPGATIADAPLPGIATFGALGRMPQAPTLGHLGVLADISVAQGIRDGLEAGQAMRTLSLHVELLERPRPGETLRGAGTLLSSHPAGIVARGVIVGEDGRQVAEALGRFMSVDGSGYTVDAETPTEPWGEVDSPRDWAWALPLEGPIPDDDADTASFHLIPAPETGNSAQMMHGGVQLRLHELAGGRLLPTAEDTSPYLPVSVATTYHRPVPIAGQRLDVEVEVVRRGRRVAVTRTRVHGPEGKLLSSAEIIWARG